MAQAYEIGDIFVFNNGPFGHVGMVHTSSDDSAWSDYIHARQGKGFHTSPIETLNKFGGADVAGEVNAWRFRPKQISSAEQDKLQRLSDRIAKRAKYGLYQAVRLRFGDSDFGSGARKQLAKFKGRSDALGDADGLIVRRLTCAEAVILCYQIVFPQNHKLFILLDAAHTMPRTLAQYLKNNDAWEMLRQP